MILTRYISVGGKDYTVHLDTEGKPVAIQVGSYSYKGRLVLRIIKKGSKVWLKVVQAMSDNRSSDQ
jgi:hypothetical protein